jgi:H+/Cl- antiporter ClcA
MRWPFQLVQLVRARALDDLGLDEWRRRLAMLASALLIGALAVLFARAADFAQRNFAAFVAREPYAPLLLTPVLFVGIAALTRSFAPASRGSGIPQVIAASRAPDGETTAGLLSIRTAAAKLLLSLAALFGGASVGREGPTVQLAAAAMTQVHKLLRVPVTSGVLIAGGAAGVAGAFNTPLAGIAFAIEELAVAYEQRIALLVMAAVMISGLSSQGIAGNYVYFGHVSATLSLPVVLIAAPVVGVGGGICGGLFSRAFLALRGPVGRWRAALGRRALTTALVCGFAVAAIGVFGRGLTWGTGYVPTKAMLEGAQGPFWFGPAKFIAVLATSVSGMPGGIFSPSLAVGAGVGNLLAPLFPHAQSGAIVMLGMAAYFVGVVRAPLTAVIIVSETTGTTSSILPLFATCLIADWAGALVCRERLYHALARDFMPPGAELTPAAEAEGGGEKG